MESIFFYETYVFKNVTNGKPFTQDEQKQWVNEYFDLNLWFENELKDFL